MCINVEWGIEKEGVSVVKGDSCRSGLVMSFYGDTPSLGIGSLLRLREWLFYNIHFIDEVLAAAQLFEDEEHVADVERDAALQ